MWSKRVVVVAVAAKLVAMVARILIIYVVYDGVSDVPRYVENGARVAVEIRQLMIPSEATTTGTEFLEFVLGVVFAVTGPNELAGFVVLTLLAGVGLYFFQRAFALGFPDGDVRRYTLLVFFLPTMLFWTSSIGKESFVTFGLGLAAYGAARSYRRERFGYVVLGVGTVTAFMVRPHVAALLAGAFAAGFLVRPAQSEDRGWASWIAGLVAAVVTVGVLVGTLGDELPVDPTADEPILDQLFEVTEERTSQGGSEFANRPVRSPLDLPHALVTVPFRPFPWEVLDNPQAVLSGMEGLALFGLLVASWRRLRELPRLAMHQPMVTMAAAYTIGFCIAFSAIGNFGILARQRAQLLPFMVILLCLPLPGGAAGDGEPAPARHIARRDRPVLEVVDEDGRPTARGVVGVD